MELSKLNKEQEPENCISNNTTTKKKQRNITLLKNDEIIDSIMLYMSRKKLKEKSRSGYVFFMRYFIQSRKGNSVNLVSFVQRRNFLKSHSIIEIIWLMV